ncbi:MAG: ABC transporter substrate-binding protein [Phycisphaerales bacterium]
MQNKFGFKDFVVVLIAGLTLLFVVMNMFQEDRRFADTQLLTQKIDEVERAVSQVRRQIESGSGNSADLDALLARLAAMNTGAGNGAGSDGIPQVLGRDESWARPGVPVTWPERWEPVNPPEDMEGFREGGAFTETFEAQMTKLTPYVYSDVYGRRVVEEIVCEQLANYDSVTLEMEGWLAEAWQMDPEGMWLRVKIRDRARFSDGMPVTGEDVRWTFEEFVFNPAIEAERARSTMPQFESVEVISERVVEFKFKEAVYSNATVALRNPILPKHFYTQFTPTQINQSTSLLMGSGAYRLESTDVDAQWRPGTPLRLVRNEQYWGRRPPVDEMRFNVITDNVARLTAFQNQTTDLIRATPEQFAAMERDQRFAEIGTQHAWPNMKSGYAFIGWNCGERNGRPTPFADPRVRRAMTMLMDRERINRDFYEGLASVATGPFSPATKQSNPDIEPVAFDVEEARRLLTEAGWIDRTGDGVLTNERGDRFTFQFTYSTGSSLGPRVGRYLADQCARVGIVCEIDVVEWAILLEKMDNRDFDSLTLAWSWSAPESDPRQLWHTDAVRNQGDNFVQYRNPRVDELIDRGRSTIDYEQRQEIWQEIHAILHEDQPYTFLLNLPWIRFVNNRVGNFHPYPVGIDKFEMFLKAQP